MSGQLEQTANILEGMQRDVESIRTVSGLHAAQFMAMSRLLDAEESARQQQSVDPSTSSPAVP